MKQQTENHSIIVSEPANGWLSIVVEHDNTGSAIGCDIPVDGITELIEKITPYIPLKVGLKYNSVTTEDATKKVVCTAERNGKVLAQFYGETMDEATKNAGLFISYYSRFYDDMDELNSFKVNEL